jgi:hypothetical protein
MKVVKYYLRNINFEFYYISHRNNIRLVDKMIQVYSSLIIIRRRLEWIIIIITAK